MDLVPPTTKDRKELKKEKPPREQIQISYKILIIRIIFERLTELHEQSHQMSETAIHGRTEALIHLSIQPSLPHGLNKHKNYLEQLIIAQPHK